MTEPLFFLFQQRLSSWWFYLLTIGYMTAQSKDFLFLKIFGHFVLLALFEISSCYLNIKGSHWLREDVEWIIAEIFGEKLMV